MEGRWVALQGKVQVSLVDPPVIVLTIDEVVRFAPFVVVGQVEEVADAIGLFANVVTVNQCVSARSKRHVEVVRGVVSKNM